MKRILTYTIDEKHNAITIRQFLEEIGCSHAVLVQLKKTTDGILKNGIWAYVNDRLNTGDTLTLSLIEPESSKNIVPVPMPLVITYEDDDILVINKPADMPIHPSINNYENTLANGVMDYFHSKGISYTFRCVNRLDRDTTGLTILASHMLSSAILSRQMTERKIHRTYLAIVCGVTDECGTIDAPIARKMDSAIEREVRADGERAVTHYRRIAANEAYSLLALHLETGRTHQIRVHMKHIGHPLIGDFLYNPTPSPLKRQALHSFCLEFMHPITGEPLTFFAPLPADMQAVFPEIEMTMLMDVIHRHGHV